MESLDEDEDAEDKCEEKEIPYAKKIQNILNRKEVTGVPSTRKVRVQQKKEVSGLLFTTRFPCTISVNKNAKRNVFRRFMKKNCVRPKK